MTAEPLCCLKADTLLRFLCSGNPVVELFNDGAVGGFAAAVSRSTISPTKLNADCLTLPDFDWPVRALLPSSSSSEKSTTNLSPCRDMLQRRLILLFEAVQNFC